MDLISDLFAAIDLSNALNSILEGASSQISQVLPIGVTLMGILAAPRIVKRIVNTFL